MVTSTGDKDQSWIITGFENGIGDTPISGFSDMRNMNVSTAPGIAKINFELARKTITTTTAPTFTANAGTDILTLSANIENPTLLTYQPFTVSSSGTLPAGLSAATTYFAIRVSSTTIKVATTLANAVAGTAVDITSTGSGTHTFTLIKPTKITHFAQKPSSYIFALDDTGRLWFDDTNGGIQWYLLDGNTRTNANGDGLVYWKNYVFVFRNTAIDVLAVSGLTSYTVTWSNSWQSINANNRNHLAIVGLDDIIYFLNGEGTSLGRYYIGSIKETTAPFAPGTASTYTFNSAALDLPKQPTALCELGTKLLIGTIGREVYPWNRTSPSFDIPIIVNETNTYCMVNRNNIAYIFAGQSGTIYQTNGSTVAITAQIPEMLTGYFYNAQAGLVYFYQAVSLGHKILFTLKTATEGFVCSLNPQNNNAIMIENTYSIGSTTITTNGTGALLSGLSGLSDKKYLASWATSTDYSIDNNGDFYVCDNYESYFTTEFFTPSTSTETATLNQIELSLLKPLTTGQAVRLSYRTSSADSFTTLVDITNTSYPSFQSGVISGADVSTIAVSGINSIQIKVELDATSTSTATPEIDYIAVKFV